MEQSTTTALDGVVAVEINPVVAVAREHRDASGDTVLSTGVSAKLTPVSAALIDEVTSRIPNPNVPTWHNPDTGRDDPNPLHPDYVAALGEANRKRGMAALDAIIMFGVGLVEPVPDTGWEKKLKRLGMEVDVSDPDEREWSYKKYVAVGAADLNRLMALSGVSQEAVARAADSFPGVP